MARRKRSARRNASNRLAMAAMALVGGAGLTAATAEAWSSPTPPSVQATDWTLQLQIRDALSDIPAFAKTNIGVRIRDGVVTLQGPVPKYEIGTQAVAIIRKIPGVVAVRNEMYTPGLEDQLAQSMPRPVTVQRLPMPVEGSPPPVTSVPQAAGQPVSFSLADQIERLRQRDRRFSDIRVELKDGRVILRGQVRRSQDAWDFADQIGRLPGVTGVTQNVATK